MCVPMVRLPTLVEATPDTIFAATPTCLPSTEKMIVPAGTGEFFEVRQWIKSYFAGAREGNGSGGREEEAMSSDRIPPF